MKLRIAAAAVLAIGVALGTAGCNMFVPQTTLVKYDPGDGVSATVGAIEVENALLISEDGKSANLVVTLVNNDTKSHRVAIQDSDTAHTTFHVTVAADSTQVLGTRGNPAVIFGDTQAKPGSLHNLYFLYGDETPVSMMVPVLDGTLMAYQDLTPKSVKPIASRIITD